MLGSQRKDSPKSTAKRDEIGINKYQSGYRRLEDHQLPTHSHLSKREEWSGRPPRPKSAPVRKVGSK